MNREAIDAYLPPILALNDYIQVHWGESQLSASTALMILLKKYVLHLSFSGPFCFLPKRRSLGICLPLERKQFRFFSQNWGKRES